jgi:hypothetical protein
MAILTVLILLFNFNNVFGNIEASLVVTTWVVFTSHRSIEKKNEARHEETHAKLDKLHETIKDNNDN